MKTFVFSFILAFLVSTANAQSKEPISIYDPIVERNFDYPAKPIIRYDAPFKEYRIAPQTSSIVSINYSDFVIKFRQNDNLPREKEAQEQSTIVVINNKIYSLDDIAFRQLDPSKILEMNIVKDDASTSSIKAIIFIKTK